MSDIKQYTIEQLQGFPEGFQYIDGDDHLPTGTVVVTYADHVAAVAEAEQRAYDNGVKDMKPWADDVHRQWDKGYEQGQRDERVAAMKGYSEGWKRQYDKGYEDAIARAVAAVEGLTDKKAHPWASLSDAIAAIKAVGE